jgi:uncharacterized protein YpuA (DUF1002 family)
MNKQLEFNFPKEIPKENQKQEHEKAPSDAMQSYTLSPEEIAVQERQQRIIDETKSDFDWYKNQEESYKKRIGELPPDA